MVKNSHDLPEAIGEWGSQNSYIWMRGYVNYYFTFLPAQALGHPAPLPTKILSKLHNTRASGSTRELAEADGS